MSQQISPNHIISETGKTVKATDRTSPYELGRNLGAAAWEQLECNADGIIELSEVFCTLLALPDASETFTFIQCLCRLLGMEPPEISTPDTVRHYSEAVYLSFSETAMALQEGI